VKRKREREREREREKERERGIKGKEFYLSIDLNIDFVFFINLAKAEINGK